MPETDCEFFPVVLINKLLYIIVEWNALDTRLINIRINCCIQAEMQHTSTAEKQSHKKQKIFDYYAFLGCKRNLPFFFAYVSNVIEWSLRLQNLYQRLFLHCSPMNFTMVHIGAPKLF